MALEDVSGVLARDFVTLMIDIDRMAGGNELLIRYAKANQGIPWFVFLDRDGTPIVDSMAPGTGNIGFPAEEHEIAYFRTMLEKVARRMTRADIDLLIKSLRGRND
jgi:hypothetical protein